MTDGPKRMTLSVSDFDAFHRVVHGWPPFPWQSRLLEQVVAERKWPRVLDLPTGSGKTTCIDIALFALALDATNPPQERWCPRRIAMVVDRRIVVDQAAERGRKLVEALETARGRDGGSTMSGEGARVLRAVADALARLCDPAEPPLAVFTLRGGIPQDDGWARSPDQPLIIASTVDQLGSRLLIQGYGVGHGMRPVHAGLAANDMLVLLDEVHLSQPFKQTLEALERLRGRFSGHGLPRRFQFAFLSATPDESGNHFTLSKADLDSSSPLAPRLRASKAVRLTRVSGRGALVERVASEALDLLRRHVVVAVVVNRVATALEVFTRLTANDSDAVLLTGRMRPLDRDDVLAGYRARIVAGARNRTPDERRLVVVGTQCIEAGADFDFDAMVSESASLDALRQRFGRVDRLGEYRTEDGNGRAEGVIVHDKEVKADRIYEETITSTVQWLEDRLDKKSRVIDFGSIALRDAPSGLRAPRAKAPTLMPAYMDLWSQTSPVPAVVPEPGLFLHGPRSGPEDVQVIWRTDIDLDEEMHLPGVVAAVSALRPSSLEAISLPFIVAKRWLSQPDGDVLEDTSDVEVKPVMAEMPGDGGRRALRWLGNDSEIVGPSEIRPGDTLVVPSAYGGIQPTSRSFDPSAKEPVPDLAERASLLARGRPLLRLHRAVVAGLGMALDVDDADAARAALGAQAADLPGWQRPWAARLGKARINVVPKDGGSDGWVVLEGRRLKADELRPFLGRGETTLEEGAEITTDEEASAYSGTEVELAAHCVHVETRVRDYAKRLGLSDSLVRDLSLAGWLHDVGKADPRFQRQLRGGSEIAYLRDEGRLLAKSGMSAYSRGELRRARVSSGYPEGTRHEVQSIAMLEAELPQLRALAHDVDLVMHLVASHHGHCRPFAPAVNDAAPVTVTLEHHQSETFGAFGFKPTTSANGLHRLDCPLADRFWALVAKYGWLELCWLEAILRLADHRASEHEVESHV